MTRLFYVVLSLLLVALVALTFLASSPSTKSLLPLSSSSSDPDSSSSSSSSPLDNAVSRVQSLSNEFPEEAEDDDEAHQKHNHEDYEKEDGDSSLDDKNHNINNKNNNKKKKPKIPSFRINSQQSNFRTNRGTSASSHLQRGRLSSAKSKNASAAARRGLINEINTILSQVEQPVQKNDSSSSSSFFSTSPSATSWRPLDCFRAIPLNQREEMIRLCKFTLSSPKTVTEQIVDRVMKHKHFHTDFNFCHNMSFPWLNSVEFAEVKNDYNKNKNNKNRKFRPEIDSTPSLLSDSVYELPSTDGSRDRKFCFHNHHGIFTEAVQRHVSPRIQLEKRFLTLAKHIRKQASSSSSGCPLDPKEFLDLVTQKGELVETGPPSQTTLLDLRIPNKCEHSLRFERLDLLALLSRVATNNKRFLGTKSLKERNRLLQPFAIVGDSPARQLFFRYVNFLRLGDKQLSFDHVAHKPFIYVIYRRRHQEKHRTSKSEDVDENDKKRPWEPVLRDYLGYFLDDASLVTNQDALLARLRKIISSEPPSLTSLLSTKKEATTTHEDDSFSDDDDDDIEIVLKVTYFFDPFDDKNDFLDSFPEGMNRRWERERAERPTKKPTMVKIYSPNTGRQLLSNNKKKNKKKNSNVTSINKNASSSPVVKSNSNRKNLDKKKSKLNNNVTAPRSFSSYSGNRHLQQQQNKQRHVTKTNRAEKKMARLKEEETEENTNSEKKKKKKKKKKNDDNDYNNRNNDDDDTPDTNVDFSRNALPAAAASPASSSSSSSGNETDGGLALTEAEIRLKIKRKMELLKKSRLSTKDDDDRKKSWFKKSSFFKVHRFNIVPPAVHLQFKNYWFVRLEGRSTGQGNLVQAEESDNVRVNKGTKNGLEDSFLYFQNLLEYQQIFSSFSSTSSSSLPLSSNDEQKEEAPTEQQQSKKKEGREQEQAVDFGGLKYRLFVLETLPIRMITKQLTSLQIDMLNLLVEGRNVHRAKVVEDLQKNLTNTFSSSSSSSTTNISVDLLPINRVFTRKMTLDEIKKHYTADALHFASKISGKSSPFVETAKNILDEFNSWILLLNCHVLLRYELQDLLL